MKTEIIRNISEELVSVKVYEKIASLILRMLMLITLGSMLAGIIAMVFHFRFLFQIDLEHALHGIILNVLTILALLEIYKTIMVYFSEGRVKISFIIDTMIVIVLTEMIGYLFREFEPYKMGMMLGIVFVLCIMRIFTVKYSPSNRELD
ncbi:MAG: phosphate-starvation-inducible PsiE family protein [bacterium]|nr:phosphate-starvation-inducible PsiE family protein [bacterium]